jgi:16S rRNA (uracil1498-N3)-methyltransferase
VQFFYCDDGGKERIEIKGENYNYLFKVRRHRKGSDLYIRDFQEPEMLYRYRVDEVSRRDALLSKLEEKQSFVEARDIVVGWCIVENRSIEKSLPALNELGVKKLYLINCDFSQKVKLDFERLNRVLKSSSMQCGRYDILEIETIENLETFLNIYPKAVAIDFGDEVLKIGCGKEILVGPEGGFSEAERDSFQLVRKLPSPYILRSETAVISASSLIASI